MIRVVVFILSIFVSACANVQFTARERYPYKAIAWRAVDDIDQFCRQLTNSQPPLFGHFNACAQYDRGGIACTIYTAKETDLTIVGHEIRHCFDGNWHD